MSLSDKQKQVQKLQEKLEKGKDIDVAAEFDDLVDYLQEHGYEIIKRNMPPTTEDRTRRHSEALREAKPRSPADIERSIKKSIKRLEASPEEVWHREVQSAIERAKELGRDVDFAEAINYIKAAHSIKKQLQTDE
jgi:hypothetical protein